ncbi:coiled-coil domain-containing protein 55 [Pseudomassariella vexata]|uniref:Coiled-coil domain-containing protein 55 n=1 Tax=Pseudomassariella vexata TaxID=1141098 RepID=A0A1Y2EF09_9PEZI|nr:coiled-coil domain-containing protein 55 [Pseudomassariella vexata]ORY70168.1 coiled-coil domain-containing protein 55 [Pseudomassariella vexata]
MSNPLSCGLNLTKKSATKPALAKRNPIFGGDDDSDDDARALFEGLQTAKITELDDYTSQSTGLQPSNKPSLKSKKTVRPSQAPSKSKKPQISVYGDLSSSLESRKHQEKAEELDPSIYDYDAVYDSLKPEKKAAPEDVERRPKYMTNLIASAATRKRDSLIAEEKKIAREREEEGEEFADKEKFVTEAYKKQQEENRRVEAEERRREDAEAKKNQGRGMTAFYADLLEKGDERHAEVMKAAQGRVKCDPQMDEAPPEKAKTDADVAREINEKGGSIALNEDGQVVDKRELLKGGLNVIAKKRPYVRKDHGVASDRRGDGDRPVIFVGAGGGKNAMRERQSRMLEAQLEQSLKRSLEAEEEERQKVERATKSRKTETDISSAKERYLARKRKVEEAKKKGLVE